MLFFKYFLKKIYIYIYSGCTDGQHRYGLTGSLKLQTNQELLAHSGKDDVFIFTIFVGTCLAWLGNYTTNHLLGFPFPLAEAQMYLFIELAGRFLRWNSYIMLKSTGSEIVD